VSGQSIHASAAAWASSHPLTTRAQGELEGDQRSLVTQTVTAPSQLRSW
jgi:hypothetical protein